MNKALIDAVQKQIDEARKDAFELERLARDLSEKLRKILVCL